MFYKDMTLVRSVKRARRADQPDVNKTQTKTNFPSKNLEVLVKCQNFLYKLPIPPNFYS